MRPEAPTGSMLCNREAEMSFSLGRQIFSNACHGPTRSGRLSPRAWNIKAYAASVTAASTATTRRQSGRQLGAKDGFDAQAIGLLQLLVLPDPAQLSLTSSPVATPLSGFRRH